MTFNAVVVSLRKTKQRDGRDINPLDEFYNDIRSQRSDGLVSQYIEDIKIPDDLEVRKKRPRKDTKSRESDVIKQHDPNSSLESVGALEKARDFQEDVLEALDFSDEDA